MPQVERSEIPQSGVERSEISIHRNERSEIPHRGASQKILFLWGESQSEHLLTTEQGQRLYECIRQAFNDLPRPGLLVLDCRQIQSITPACVHHILKIFHERKQEGETEKYMLIQLQDDSSDLKTCFRLVAKEEGLVLLCCDEMGNWELLGKLTHAERSTLEVVQTLGSATSEQVSHELKLPPAAASNRLRQLYQMGLAVREEASLPLTGGRRFTYSFVLSFPFQKSPVECV